MIDKIKNYIVIILLIGLLVFGGLFIITKNKLETTKKDLAIAQIELVNSKEFYAKRVEDNKKIQETYNKIIANLKSDNCGSSAVPNYIYEAIQNLEGK